MTTDQIVNILILAVILLLSIGFHEYAHARASNKLGDPTPKLQGRLTPNPLAHIDPMGFLLIFIIHFGWGKPVQINPNYYKNPRIDEFLVAIAGPLTNILMAIIGIVVLKIYSGNLAVI
jgi:Zn-dependent protease